MRVNELACIVKSVNPRTESHGDRKILCVDIKVEFVLPSSALSLFHPDLTTTLYRRPDHPDLVEQADPDLLTEPRFPQANPIRWDDLALGQVSLKRALFDTIVLLPRCDIGNFALDCNKAGRVGISCRIQSKCDEDTIGMLAGLLDAVSTMTILPPP